MARADRSAYRQFRAPREDGQSLVDPGWSELPQLVATNQELAAGFRYEFGATPLAKLRRAARKSLLCAAGAPADAPDLPLTMSGHQPELFHPGVWFKNFVLDRLARQAGGVGVNLVIDSDLCRTPSINVPTGTVTAPRVEAVPFDAASAALPYEQRGVLDRGMLTSFPDRVGELLGGLVDRPLVETLWPRVVAAVDAGEALGAAIGAARHALESAWGLANHEAPISAVCDSTPFRVFAVDLLQRLDEFHTAHNRALAEYRTAHKIRTPAQPIPDLHRHEGWLESPFWVWSERDPERRPLYARRTTAGLLLSDLQSGEWLLPAGGAFKDLAAVLAEMREEAGVKIRSRALVTTLFARLLLADVFIHGIGGAKYDQVADRAAELFYGFAPPPHATATATLRLPIPHAPRIHRERPREIAAELRSLEFHPEEHIAASEAGATAPIEMKRDWLRVPKTPLNAVARHRGIVSANEALQPFVRRRREELVAEQREVADRMRATAVLESREYAFCLFPEQWLRGRMQQFVEYAE